MATPVASRRRSRLSPYARKAALVVHVVATAIALNVHALTTSNVTALHGAYSFFDVVDRTIFPPLAVGTLVSGLVLSFGTIWDLFHYPWVMTKPLLTTALIATGIALVDRWTASALDALADGADADAYALRLVGVSVAHIVMLIAATVLSIYKPWVLAPMERQITSGALLPPAPTCIELDKDFLSGARFGERFK